MLIADHTTGQLQKRLPSTIVSKCGHVEHRVSGQSFAEPSDFSIYVKRIWCTFLCATLYMGMLGHTLVAAVAGLSVRMYSYAYTR